MGWMVGHCTRVGMAREWYEPAGQEKASRKRGFLISDESDWLTPLAGLRRDLHLMRVQANTAVKSHLCRWPFTSGAINPAGTEPVVGWSSLVPASMYQPVAESAHG